MINDVFVVQEEKKRALSQEKADTPTANWCKDQTCTAVQFSRDDTPVRTRDSNRNVERKKNSPLEQNGA